MRRTAHLGAALLLISACALSGSDQETTQPVATTRLPAVTTVEESSFPVTVDDANGQVTIEAEPQRIVSLSSTATETLFAIGAGEQVVAVDEFSTYPEDAPVTDLSGFTPNLEAIVAYEPDLVLISYDPGELETGLEAVGIPSLLLTTALSLDEAYSQIEVIGAATGHGTQAAEVVSGMQSDIEQIVESTEVPDGLTFYHEVDATLYSASSASFLGQVYALLGMENIADAADPEGTGFPQLASEYIVSQDPDLIVLADVDFGVSPDSLVDRPGWAEMTAVRNGSIVELEAYLASNWGPRVVELLQTVADAVAELDIQS